MMMTNKLVKDAAEFLRARSICGERTKGDQLLDEAVRQIAVMQDFIERLSIGVDKLSNREQDDLGIEIVPVSDQIEALEAENVRLRGALKPFAFLEDDSVQEAWELRYQDRFKDWIDFGDMEAARAALEGGK